MPKKTRKDSPDIKSQKNTTRRKLKLVEPVKPTPIVDTIVNTLSTLNPFGATNTSETTEKSSVATVAATGLQQNDDKTTCEDKRCPVGFRCDENKICYRLTDIELQSNGKKLVLSVDGNREKEYDIDSLNRNFDRVLYLKNGKIDGKRITGSQLKTIISGLKSKIKGDTKSTYYGTLNDEMIIQIIHLEQIERSERVPVSPENEVQEPIPLPSVGVNIDDVTDEPNENPFTEPVAEVPELNKSVYEVPEPDTSANESENNLQDKIGIPPENIDSKKYNQYMLEK